MAHEAVHRPIARQGLGQGQELARAGDQARQAEKRHARAAGLQADGAMRWGCRGLGAFAALLPAQGQRGQIGGLHHIGQRDARRSGPGAAQAREQLQAEDGIAAQLEEVVMAADLRRIQQFAPEVRQHGFGFAPGRLEGPAASQQLARIRQGLAVHLAVGVERQLLQHHDGARHHVVGQALREPPAQRIALHRRARLRGHIGHQSARSHDDDGLAHLGQVQQLRLHLPQLDAQAPDLHLVVQPAQVVDLPLGIPAHQVARAVEPLAPAEGAGHEALGREARLVQVAPRQADASDVELACHALGTGFSSASRMWAWVSLMGRPMGTWLARRPGRSSG